MSDQINEHLDVTPDTLIYTNEASSLDWKPGYRASSFMLYGAEFKLVAAETNEDGDVMYFLYWSYSIKKHAKIFND